MEMKHMSLNNSMKQCIAESQARNPYSSGDF